MSKKGVCEFQFSLHAYNKPEYLKNEIRYEEINVVCCVGSVQMQIEIWKCQCTACRYADMDSEVDEFRAYALRQKINRKNK